MGRLEGRIALVTGSARGTGAATARLFAREGARVLIADVRDEAGEAVAAEIGDAARYRHLDVTREDDWQRAVAFVEAEWGALHVLVNNAAILDVAPLSETSVETFRRVVDVNQTGTFLGVRSAIEPMKRAGGGSIVNVSSIDGLEGNNGVLAYTSSKWGVRGITKAAAMELGQYGIRVNTVCPNPGSPEMVQPFFAAAAERLKGRSERLPDRPIHPFARQGTIDDVARAILFLASDESAFVCGVDLPVDGGFTAGKIEPGAPRG